MRDVIEVSGEDRGINYDAFYATKLKHWQGIAFRLNAKCLALSGRQLDRDASTGLRRHQQCRFRAIP